jgi:site-specific DNA recombinase
LPGTTDGRRAVIDRRLAALTREAEEADERSRRLYKLVEDGRDEVDDILSAASRKALAALERARSGTRAVEDISPIVVERFTRTMREKLTTGEVPFRKAYPGSQIDRIEVDDGEVRIVGRARKCWNRPSWRADWPARCS